MQFALLNTYKMNLKYGLMLLRDIPDEMMTVLGGGLTNHPAWLVGHMVIASDRCLSCMGIGPGAPEGYEALFANKTSPICDPSIYPSKAELVAEYELGHERVASALEMLNDEQLHAELPDERMRQVFPTVEDAVMFMMTAHEAVHLGQLSAWRREAGLPSVF